VVEPLQQQAADRVETPAPAVGRSALGQLKEQIDRLRRQLQSLPTVELGNSTSSTGELAS